MSFFGDWGPALGALNPVALGANLFAGGLDYLASEQDRRYAEGAARAGNELASRQYDSNMAMQREFAQHGIRWRVADAEAAGLHPLAALGSQGSSYSPSYSAFTSSSGTSSAGNAYRALSGMGQNLSRALMATATSGERAEQSLRLRNMELQNELLAEQIAGAQFENMRQVGPPMPIGDTEYFSDSSGRRYSLPSREFQDAVAGSTLYNLRWMFENKFLPRPAEYRDALGGRYRGGDPYRR